ncbi:MAG: hypothetical protein K1X35_03730 [Caulobacteraceae bacterium]|nr:hypothetical protein [Caulobacteraceae bacterium]
MTSDTAGSHQLSTQQLLKVAQTAESAGDMDRALGFYRGLGEIEPRNPRWAFEAVRVLRKSDRNEEAREALSAALRKWPRASSNPALTRLVPELNPSEAQLRSALREDMPDDSALKRPVIEDDGSSDCIVARGGRKEAVLVFTGLADRMTMPLPLFDRYLAELDLSAVYLRDTKRIGYFNGVASLADDYDGTIVRLKELLVDLGAMAVHTIGNSAGGMAAVSYGLDLHARTVLGFSAPVALTREAADLDRRTAVFAERILGPGVPPERRDLRARALKSRGVTRIHLYYGKDMPEDRFHASAMEEVPCVTLHPIEGLAGHGALFRIAENRGLRRLFAETFAKADA